jgi:fluoroquinolone transport system permease protein
MNAVRLVRTVIWDLRLQATYQIMTVAAVVTLLYIGIFRLLVRQEMDEILILLIFTDPAMLGFIFIGALVLFEKSSNTLEALIVTPLRIPEYLFSKAISLGLIAVFCALVMAVAGHGWDISYPEFIYSVFITSCVVTFLGFAGASRVRSFNQYIIIIPMFLTPLAIPLLNFLGLTGSRLMYLLPTQATLNLLQASFNPVPVWELVYALIYLPLWGIISYYYAEYSFRRHIIVSDRT